MIAERHVEVAVPADIDADTKQVSRLVEGLWSEFGLQSTPVVALVDGALGQGRVDGRVIPASQRRVAAARSAGRDPAEVLALTVDGALRAALAQLVRAEPDVDPAVAMAAELGLAPAQLVAPVDGSGGVFERCDELVRRATQSIRPVIELHPATLRRLTSGPAMLDRELLFGGRVLGGMSDELRTDYGVRLPPIGLAVADQPEHLVRFRFGSCRSAAHVVLGEHERVVRLPPEEIPELLGPRSFVDPLHGFEWSIVDLSLVPGWDGSGTLDPAVLVMRCLHAELKCRLALLGPAPQELFVDWWFPLKMTDAQRTVVSAAFRWLLVSQASLSVAARLAEGVITALAGGEIEVDGLVGHLRRTLGPAVLGPVPTTTPYRLVEFDAAAVEAAVQAGSAAPLLAGVPELTTAIDQHVVVCPPQWRAEVSRLLLSLADAVVVVGKDEFAAAVGA